MKKRLLLIAAVVCLLYAPALRNGFVWDDTALVLRDPLIRSWRLIPEGFRHFLFLDATASDFYRPLQRLTYSLDYALYALAPWGYHLTNILLHTAAALALFLFIQQAINTRVALVVALLWGVHPLHTSAVVYISGRADILAALFGFAGLYLALRQKTWPAALCLLGALLSKESGAIFIPLALLFAGKHHLRRWWPAIGLVLALYLSLRFSAERIPTPSSQPTRIAARPLLVSRAVAEYAGLILAPIHLHMERNLGAPPKDPERACRNARWREWQTLLGVLLLVALILWMRRSRSPWLWAFLIAYLPVSNVFSLNATAAEHWLYLPLPFLLAAAVRGLEPKRWAAPAALLAIALLAARTAMRIPDWKNQRTFLERTIAAGGDSARMFIQMGVLESNQGNQKLALQHFQKALELCPGQSFALLDMANAHLRDSNPAQAREFLQKAGQHPFLRPQVLELQSALEPENAIRLLNEAVAQAPSYWPLRKRYLLALDKMGETAKAIHELAAFLEVQDFRAESWLLLGQLLQKTGQSDTAMRAFHQAALYDVHLPAKRD